MKKYKQKPTIFIQLIFYIFSVDEHKLDPKKLLKLCKTSQFPITFKIQFTPTPLEYMAKEKIY